MSLSTFAQILLNQSGMLMTEKLMFGQGSPFESSEEQLEQEQTLLSLMANAEGLGFAFNKVGFERLQGLKTEELVSLYQIYWPALQAQMGAHRSFKPMYPNFPEQVMEASDAELAMNAFSHYQGDIYGIRELPHYPDKKRPQLREKHGKARILKVATVTESFGVWLNNLSSQTAWSETQREMALQGLEWVVEMDKQYPDEGFLNQVRTVLSSGQLKQRENKAYILGAWLKMASVLSQTDASVWTQYVEQGTLKQTILGLEWPLSGSSITDVLRVACAVSEGDATLVDPTRFISFSRKLRRGLLAMMEEGSGVASAVEDLFLRRERFLRLGERLHPGEMKQQFPKSDQLFQQLRQGLAPPSWMGNLDAVLKTPYSASSMQALQSLVAERPGSMARQLHRVLRWLPSIQEQTQLVQAFAGHAAKVSTPLLLGMHPYFATQHEGKTRPVLPKGNVSKIFVLEKDVQAIDQGIASQVVEVVEKVLVERFKAMPALGACYVEKGLDRISTPYAMRATSRSLHTVPRGSRLEMDPQATVTRLFLWWNEQKPDGTQVDRIDLDLSCLVLDQQFQTIANCSFHDLRSPGMTHSGDLTSAPQGAAEFIDIEHQKLPKQARYVVMMVNSFTTQKYSDMPECYAGWMYRKSPKSGEIFEPSTVANRFDLSSDAQSAVPMALDLQTKEVIWLDMPFRDSYGYRNTAMSQKGTVEQLIKGFSDLSKPTLGLLFRLHAQARGTLVETPEEADVLFTVHPQDQKPGINGFEHEKVSEQWLIEANGTPWIPFDEEESLDELSTRKALGL